MATRMSTPLRSCGDLRVDLDAAEDHRGLQREVRTVGADAFGDLRGQFAGRYQDQGARLIWAVVALAGLDQALQHRQREAGGLAGAGLRGGEYVATLQHDRDGLGLDGGGLGVTLGFERAQKFSRQAEGIK